MPSVDSSARNRSPWSTDDARREAAVITFVVTASGLSLFGIGAAFWGLVAGVIANFVFAGSRK